MTNKNARHGPGANIFKSQSQFITFAEVKQRARGQWPAILANFEWPEGINTLAICMDNDRNQCGQEAGKALARRLFRLTPPPVIKLLTPDKPDTDWLDVWGDKSHG